MGWSEGCFNSVADQRSRKRPLESADPSHSSCLQAPFKIRKTYDTKLVQMRPQWRESEITRAVISKGAASPARVQCLCVLGRRHASRTAAGPPGAVV